MIASSAPEATPVRCERDYRDGGDRSDEFSQSARFRLKNWLKEVNAPLNEISGRLKRGVGLKPCDKGLKFLLKLGAILAAVQVQFDRRFFCLRQRSVHVIHYRFCS